MNWIENKKRSSRFWQVTFTELPTTLDLLRRLPEANLTEPYYAAALLIPVLCIWPTNKEAALDMVNFLKGPQRLSMHEMQFVNDRLRGKEYLPFSYFKGSIPENGYEPIKPYTVTVSTISTSFDEVGYAKLYLQSSGADSPRPVQLRQRPTSGEWFLWEQMLLSDIRKPISADPWA